MQDDTKWYHMTRKKGSLLILFIAAFIGGIFGTLKWLEAMQQPIIVFQTPIVLEYGQHSSVDEISDTWELEAYDVSQLINVEESDVDAWSLYEEEIKGEAYEPKEFRLNTQAVGEFEGTVYAIKGKNVKAFPFTYTVEDTHKPSLEGVSDIEVNFGENPVFSFTGNDIIDKELEVSIEGSFDVNEAGTYPLTASVVDVNGNKTEEAFQLMVKEKLKPKESPNKGGSSTLYSGSSSDKVVALTFDDGPHPSLTPRLLEILERKNVPATFFVLGQNAQAYPQIVKDAHQKGHEIENHSTSHKNIRGASKAVLDEEVEKTNQIIESITGRRPQYFRPPYGSYDGNTSANISNTIALWSVDTEDWKSRSASAVQSVVRSQTRNGSVILMHDIHKSTIDAVEGLIDQLRADGYRFVKLSDLS